MGSCTSMYGYRHYESVLWDINGVSFLDAFTIGGRKRYYIKVCRETTSPYGLPYHCECDLILDHVTGHFRWKDDSLLAKWKDVQSHECYGSNRMYTAYLKDIPTYDVDLISDDGQYFTKTAPAFTAAELCDKTPANFAGSSELPWFCESNADDTTKGTFYIYDSECDSLVNGDNGDGGNNNGDGGNTNADGGNTNVDGGNTNGDGGNTNENPSNAEIEQARKELNEILKDVPNIVSLTNSNNQLDSSKRKLEKSIEEKMSQKTTLESSKRRLQEKRQEIFHHWKQIQDENARQARIRKNAIENRKKQLYDYEMETKELMKEAKGQEIQVRRVLVDQVNVLEDMEKWFEEVSGIKRKFAQDKLKKVGDLKKLNQIIYHIERELLKNKLEEEKKKKEEEKNKNEKEKENNDNNENKIKDDQQGIVLPVNLPINVPGTTVPGSIPGNIPANAPANSPNNNAQSPNSNLRQRPNNRQPNEPEEIEMDDLGDTETEPLIESNPQPPTEIDVTAEVLLGGGITVAGVALTGNEKDDPVDVTDGDWPFDEYFQIVDENGGCITPSLTSPKLEITQCNVDSLLQFWRYDSRYKYLRNLDASECIGRDLRNNELFLKECTANDPNIKFKYGNDKRFYLTNYENNKVIECQNIICMTANVEGRGRGGRRGRGGGGRGRGNGNNSNNRGQSFTPGQTRRRNDYRPVALELERPDFSSSNSDPYQRSIEHLHFALHRLDRVSRPEWYQMVIDGILNAAEISNRLRSFVARVQSTPSFSALFYDSFRLDGGVISLSFGRTRTTLGFSQHYRTVLSNILGAATRRNFRIGGSVINDSDRELLGELLESFSSFVKGRGIVMDFNFTRSSANQTGMPANHIPHYFCAEHHSKTIMEEEEVIMTVSVRPSPDGARAIARCHFCHFHGDQLGSCPTDYVPQGFFFPSRPSRGIMQPIPPSGEIPPMPNFSHFTSETIVEFREWIPVLPYADPNNPENTCNVDGTCRRPHK